MEISFYVFDTAGMNQYKAGFPIKWIGIHYLPTMFR